MGGCFDNIVSCCGGVACSQALPLPSEVLFGSGRDKFNLEAIALLDEAVDLLEIKYDKESILIEGYADNLHMKKGAKFSGNLRLSKS